MIDLEQKYTQIDTEINQYCARRAEIAQQIKVLSAESDTLTFLIEKQTRLRHTVMKQRDKAKREIEQTQKNIRKLGHVKECIDYILAHKGEMYTEPDVFKGESTDELSSNYTPDEIIRRAHYLHTWRLFLSCVNDGCKSHKTSVPDSDDDDSDDETHWTEWTSWYDNVKWNESEEVSDRTPCSENCSCHKRYAYVIDWGDIVKDMDYLKRVDCPAYEQRVD